MEKENQRLQETRRTEIPETITKYKALIDGIFDEVAKPFPTFKNIEIKNKDNELVSSLSAEEQYYSHALMREKAIDHADRMLNKINELELELHSPELFHSLKNTPTDNVDPNKKEPAKKRNFLKEKVEKKE